MSKIERYLDIWRELCTIPIPERPAKLRQEMDTLWDGLSKEDKLKLDTIFAGGDFWTE